MRHSAFLFLTFRLRSGPLEGPATVKPPALPEDTYLFLTAVNRACCEGTQFIGNVLNTRLIPHVDKSNWAEVSLRARPTIQDSEDLNILTG
jgi:hypothetical protein